MSQVITIQNVDRIIKRRDYDHLGTDKLLVTSFFRTIQGEGPFAGYPAIFVRLAGCNFGDKVDHCQWCDTAFQFDRGTVYTFEELLLQLKALPGWRPQDILVITGGEPTLQHNLVDFLAYVYRSGVFHTAQLETNGTQASFFEKLFNNEDAYTLTSVVVSPKASNKTNSFPELSEKVLDCTEALKFVVCADPGNSQFVIPSWADRAREEYGLKVYVSPMAVYKRPYEGEVSSIWDDSLIDQKATAENYAYAAQYAMNNGYLLSLQTHLFLAVP